MPIATLAFQFSQRFPFAARVSSASGKLNVSAISVTTGLTRKDVRTLLDLTKEKNKLRLRDIALLEAPLDVVARDLPLALISLQVIDEEEDPILDRAPPLANGMLLAPRHPAIAKGR